ncbi:MAG: tetratricopeptide repeat protein [Candidatus Omnitrophica bacterium]|nr:tetratricopeptide repeat protein [Candidatus Omnitrophota bacterium]
MRKMSFLAGWVLSGMMLASCASHSSKHSFGPYSDAEIFYRHGNYPKAIEKYQEYLTVNPQGGLAATAQYYIAKSYVASGDTNQARENFERVVKEFPGTSWAAFAEEQLESFRESGKFQ